MVVGRPAVKAARAETMAEMAVEEDATAEGAQEVAA